MTPVVHSSVTHTWRTPASFLDLVRAVGPIALDPCTSADNPTSAWRYATPEESREPHVCGLVGHDGLLSAWAHHVKAHDEYTGLRGLCWVNCPYGRALGAWAAKCSEEARLGAEIILLVPARPDTRWAGVVMESATSILFWRGRIKFEGAPAGAPFPSMVCYWGPRERRFREAFAGRGLFVCLKSG